MLLPWLNEFLKKYRLNKRPYSVSKDQCVCIVMDKKTFASLKSLCSPPKVVVDVMKAFLLLVYQSEDVKVSEHTIWCQTRGVKIGEGTPPYFLGTDLSSEFYLYRITLLWFWRLAEFFFLAWFSTYESIPFINNATRDYVHVSSLFYL